MNANVNIEEVKKYNASLKQYKDAAAQLKAQKDYVVKEISNKCTELSKELGMEVTPDNIETVYEDLCSKINSSLQAGNVVLAKIAQEANKAEANTNQSAGVSSVNPVPVQFEQQEPVSPVISNDPVVNTSSGLNLPPLFSI